ncbi:MAG: ComEC/Rec2 family competence protein [Henriciella sp.]
MEIRYVCQPSTWLVRRAGNSAESSGSKQLLLGQRLHVDVATASNGWIAAQTVPKEDGSFREGFVREDRICERQQLKVFYTDVGQGDAVLIEAEGVIVIIDGGPSRGFADQLHRRLSALRRADQAVGVLPRDSLHIDAVIISHFDKDHYVGLTRVLNNSDYSFGTIYHNGLPRYGDGAGKDLDLGDFSASPHGGKAISTDLRGLETAQSMIDDNVLLTPSGNLNMFGKFLQAALDAKAQGRLDGFELLVSRDPSDPNEHLSNLGNELKFEVLGPITTTMNGRIRLQAFPDPHSGSSTPSESHTINGNSIVLRMTYGQNTFLFGGDLNQPSQRYLHDRYGSFARFSAEVNKACHHGSSDFDVEYLKAIRPLTTVFSSGDNGNYDHPMPDAMGAAARHSDGDYPLIFSTELARETGSRGIHFGHINARSNGDVTVMAQKRESPSSKKAWHSFPLPYQGPFHH